MTELDVRRSPWNSGLDVSSEYLNHQLYLLGCIVHASPAIDGLGPHGLAGLREQFQETEVGRILLTVAVAVRNAMDQNPGRAEYWLKGVDDNVGILQVLNRDKQPGVLQFREACNKLIHCVSINFDYADETPRRGAALKPVVHIYGSLGKDEWKATIDLNKFVDVAFQLT